MSAFEIEALVEEYRAGVTECVHHGMICIVGENGIVSSLGSCNWTSFYRSASKPMQALPVLTLGLDRKYGLTEEETAIFSGSHWGDDEHIRVCESILRKTGLREEDMVMKSSYPSRIEQKESMIRANLPPRKIYHNCSGKHMALMLLARELGSDVRDYWRQESLAQNIVQQVISYISDTPFEQISVGVDGCGVPVFAVPFHAIARTYLKLACPEFIDDSNLRNAVVHNMKCLHQYPNMIAGEHVVDTIISNNPDMIAKSGAMGLYAIGVHSKKLGVAFKILDGSHDEFGLVAAEILTQLEVAPDTVSEIRQHYPDSLINDNQDIVGKRKSVFRIQLRE